MPVFLAQNHALLRVSGADATGFLQGLLTQDMAALRPDQWQWAALLSPQGKTLFDMLIRLQDADFLLDVEADRRAELLKKLNMYKLRAAVNISAEADTVIVGWDTPTPDHAAHDSRHPRLGWRGIGDAAADTTNAYRQHRWSLGIAEGARELGIDRLLWLEANANELGGVSFTKGCYVGQENTARMHHRGKVRKRLFVFKNTGAGDTLMAGERPAGDVLHQQDNMGVALLRLDYLYSELTLGGAPVRLICPDWLEPQLKSD
jgi:folate-binding protein YgfZ